MNRINKTRIRETFSRLVSIDSPSYGESITGEYVKSRLSALGISAEEDDTGEKIGGDCGNIYAYIDGSLSKAPLLFCAHMDTVEPSRGKKTVTDANGVIRSGGDTILGADDASGITAILEALTVLRESNLPHRPIELLFTVAEEVYCRGIKRFDMSKLRSKEAYVLDLTGPVGTAAYHAPAICRFTADVTGKASHAGFAPEDGISAISAAVKAISNIKSGRVGIDTTLNIGMIKGGHATNIVPDSCSVMGEIRSLLNEKAKACLEDVRNRFETAARSLGAKVSFSEEIICPAYETDPSHPVIKRFEAACGRLGIPSGLIKTFGGSDNNILSGFDIKGIVLACAINDCHSLREYTTVDELARISELTLELMTA